VSWFVDRGRRRRNARLDERGQLGQDDVVHGADGPASLASERNQAEAMFWVLRNQGKK
jgi:hypothetical protein